MLQTISSTSMNVTNIDKQLFEAIRARQSDDNWLIFFGSLDCPYTVKLLPIWKYIANNMESTKTKLGAVNCILDYEICQEMKITYYPTIYLFWDTDRKHMIEFSGERSIENLQSFIKNPGRVYKRIKIGPNDHKEYYKILGQVYIALKVAPMLILKVLGILTVFIYCLWFLVKKDAHKQKSI